jgi:hypothetical protein
MISGLLLGWKNGISEEEGGRLLKYWMISWVGISFD